MKSKDRKGQIKESRRKYLSGLICGRTDCKYAISLGGGMCDYMATTGHMRGCPPTYDYEKYEKVRKRKA